MTLIGGSVFKLFLRGLAWNAFHLDADPSEIPFARFGSEAGLCETRVNERDGVAGMT